MKRQVTHGKIRTLAQGGTFAGVLNGTFVGRPVLGGVGD